MGKNFALIGAGGDVAPRHMKAIRDTGNNLVAAIDKSDSVGILDSFSHDISFFTEFERFDRHVEKLRRSGDEKRLHYVTICSPNYLHDAHMRFALHVGADAICEKVASTPDGKRYAIDLTYITSRGRWYFTSWKGDIQKSGGVATNIGVHFFDVLIWVFGNVRYHEVHLSEPARMSGIIELEKAYVRWFMSVDGADLPEQAVAAGKSTFRSMTVDDEEIEFSDGFTDLHTVVYREILAGRGSSIEDARPSINLVYELRNANASSTNGSRRHPLLRMKR